MRQTRRDFLRHATLAACAAAIPQSAFAATPFEDLIAKVARRQLLPD
ncbi:MAG: twin-arginine translocation signal domain-containing protein, partial [Pikeienuella sp.]